MGRDSAIVRAYEGRRRAKKETDPARGRSRGCFRTQVPLIADRRNRPLGLRLTGGQRPDRTQARALVEA